MLVDELDVADAPIRLFHGADDDWALAEPCRAFTARLREAGKDVVMTEYSGALHNFDIIDLGPEPIVIERGQNLAKCERREENGQIVNVETSAAFTWQDSCVKLGATIAYAEAAYNATKADVTAFLVKAFKLD
jgi:dienelactone hydrolase